MKWTAVVSFVAIAIATTIIQFPVTKILDWAWQQPALRTAGTSGIEVPAPDYGTLVAARDLGLVVTTNYNPGYVEIDQYNPGRAR